MPARKKSAKKKPATRRKAAPKRKVAASRKKAAAPKRKAAPKRSTATAPRMATPAAVPSAIGASSHHFDYTTHDLDSVKRFYVEKLGFTNFNHDSNFNYLWIQTGQTSSLGFMPPWPQGESTPAKEPTLYFMVKDVDRAYAELSAKGVAFEGPPADMPWGHRTIRTTDPEGRIVMLATRKEES